MDTSRYVQILLTCNLFFWSSSDSVLCDVRQWYRKVSTEGLFDGELNPAKESVQFEVEDMLITSRTNPNKRQVECIVLQHFEDILKSKSNENIGQQLNEIDESEIDETELLEEYDATKREDGDGKINDENTLENTIDEEELQNMDSDHDEQKTVSEVEGKLQYILEKGDKSKEELNEVFKLLNEIQSELLLKELGQNLELIALRSKLMANQREQEIVPDEKPNNEQTNSHANSFYDPNSEVDAFQKAIERHINIKMEDILNRNNVQEHSKNENINNDSVKEPILTDNKITPGENENGSISDEKEQFKDSNNKSAHHGVQDSTEKQTDDKSDQNDKRPTQENNPVNPKLSADDSSEMPEHINHNSEDIMENLNLHIQHQTRRTENEFDKSNGHNENNQQLDNDYLNTQNEGTQEHEMENQEEFVKTKHQVQNENVEQLREQKTHEHKEVKENTEPVAVNQDRMQNNEQFPENVNTPDHGHLREHQKLLDTNILRPHDQIGISEEQFLENAQNDNEKHSDNLPQEHGVIADDNRGLESQTMNLKEPTYINQEKETENLLQNQEHSLNHDRNEHSNEVLRTSEQQKTEEQQAVLDEGNTLSDARPIIQENTEVDQISMGSQKAQSEFIPTEIHGPRKKSKTGKSNSYNENAKQDLDEHVENPSDQTREYFENFNNQIENQNEQIENLKEQLENFDNTLEHDTKENGLTNENEMPVSSTADTVTNSLDQTDMNHATELDTAYDEIHPQTDKRSDTRFHYSISFGTCSVNTSKPVDIFMSRYFPEMKQKACRTCATSETTNQEKDITENDNENNKPTSNTNLFKPNDVNTNENGNGETVGQNGWEQADNIINLPTEEEDVFINPRSDYEAMSAPVNLVNNEPQIPQQPRKESTEKHERPEKRSELENTKTEDFNLNAPSVENVQMAQDMNHLKSKTLEYSNKIQSLEIMVMKLQNQLLMEKLDQQNHTGTITRLENSILRLENELLRLNHSHFDLLMENENFQKQKKKYLELDHVPQGASKQNSDQIAKSKEMITEQQSRIGQLAELLKNQSKAIHHMKTKYEYLEDQNRMLFQMVMNQSALMTQIMTRVQELSDQNIQHKLDNYKMKEKLAKAEVENSKEATEFSEVSGKLMKKLDEIVSDRKLDMTVVTDRVNREPRYGGNGENPNLNTMRAKLLADSTQNWCGKERMICIYKSIRLSSCVPFVPLYWSVCEPRTTFEITNPRLELGLDRRHEIQTVKNIDEISNKILNNQNDGESTKSAFVQEKDNKLVQISSNGETKESGEKLKSDYKPEDRVIDKVIDEKDTEKQSVESAETTNTQSGQSVEAINTKSSQSVKTINTQSNQPVETINTQSGQSVEAINTQSSQTVETTNTQSGQTVETTNTQGDQTVETTNTQSGETVETTNTQSDPTVETTNKQPEEGKNKVVEEIKNKEETKKRVNQENVEKKGDARKGKVINKKVKKEKNSITEDLFDTLIENIPGGEEFFASFDERKSKEDKSDSPNTQKESEQRKKNVAATNHGTDQNKPAEGQDGSEKDKVQTKTDKQGENSDSIGKKIKYKREQREPKDCYDHYLKGMTRNAIYKIKPYALDKPLDVYCDMKTGGWTMLQKRSDGTTKFFKEWSEYKNGFGGLYGEHWIGNDNIHYLTNQGNYKLRIELTDWNKTVKIADYDVFIVEDEGEGYRLTVDGYHGNAGDGMAKHNGHKFSTKDVDNDKVVKEFGGSCAKRFSGAWWYYKCYMSNLNGIYYRNGQIPSKLFDGITWKPWTGSNYSLRSVEMKIKPLSAKDK